MGFTLNTVTPIDGEAIVSLAAAKAHLRVLDEEENESIAAMRDAAVDWVERHVGRSLSRRTWRWTGSAFSSAIGLPIEPVQSIVGITYLDMTGATIAVPDGGWRFAASRLLPAIGTCWPVALPVGGAVTVTFEAGYTDLQTEAPALLAAVKLLIGHFHRFRAAVVCGTSVMEVPMGVTALCASYRTPVMV